MKHCLCVTTVAQRSIGYEGFGLDGRPIPSFPPDGIENLNVYKGASGCILP